MMFSEGQCGRVMFSQWHGGTVSDLGCCKKVIFSAGQVGGLLGGKSFVPESEAGSD